MSDLCVELTRDALAFRDRAWALLAARPETNLLATMLEGTIDGRFRPVTPLFATLADGEGHVRAAALRTPRESVLCTELEPAGAAALIDRWLPEDPDLSGVGATPTTARAIVEAWCRRTGGSSQMRMAMAMHALDAVSEPPRPAPGALAVAGPGLHELLIAWWRAFAVEAGLAERDDDPTPGVRARVRDGSLYVWLVGGRPVSLVGVHAPVAGVARVGPVYTPPPERGRGYASSAVAAVSRHVLAGGAERMMLFTDLANPTSNKIYADVGYRRFADWEEYALTAA